MTIGQTCILWTILSCTARLSNVNSSLIGEFLAFTVRCLNDKPMLCGGQQEIGQKVFRNSVWKTTAQYNGRKKMNGTYKGCCWLYGHYMGVKG